MVSDADHPDLDTETWDLDDTVVVRAARAGGAQLQEGESTKPKVYIEFTGHPYGEPDREVTHRMVLDLDRYFDVMAQLEHAGMTALLVEAI